MRRQIWVGCAFAIGSGTLPAAAQVLESSRDVQWQLATGGLSYHSRETAAPGREWQDTHAGLGLHRRVRGLPWDSEPGSDWATRLMLGALEDSRGFMGGYAGVGVFNELARIAGIRFDGGVSAALYYRSASWSGRMHLVPALLPTLAFTEPRTGLGADLAWIPPAKTGWGNSVSTLFLQFNYRL